MPFVHLYRFVRRWGIAAVVVVLAVLRALRTYIAGRKPVGWTLRRLIEVAVQRDSLTRIPPRDLELISETIAYQKAPLARVNPYQSGAVKGFWIGFADHREVDTIVHLFWHGGAYVTLSPLVHLEALEAVLRLARTKPGPKIAIFVGHYTLATDAPYPVQLNEAVATYLHLTRDLNIAPERIVVGGDSAGGHLTMSMLLALRERKIPLPAGIILVSPWVTFRTTAASYERNRDVDVLDVAWLSDSAKQFLGSQSPDAPQMTPLDADLRGLPRALVFAGEQEIFVDDITDFVSRYRAANGDGAVEYELAPLQVHDYVVTLPPAEARASHERYVAFIRLAAAGSSPA